MRLAAPSPTLAEHARYPWFVLGTVCLGTFMGSIDLSGINATFPILASAFDTTVAIGLAIGPILGGLLTDWLGWR